MSKLKWTKEMEYTRHLLISSPQNKEDFEYTIVKQALNKNNKPIMQGKYKFFFHIPICLAGSSSKFDAYELIKNKNLIDRVIPKPYKAVAWYGWGGCGWLAQVV